MSNYSVSILVPIYNASIYIETCATSLFSQTIKEIEYIFVDDGTTDDSIELLNSVTQRFPERTGDVIIIKHTKNCGISAARQTAFNQAHGEYVLAMDSDDYIADNMIEMLYNEAKAKNADVVFCDYISETNEQSLLRKFPFSYKKEKLIEVAILGDSALWNKLFKRSLLTDYRIRTLDGIDHGDDLAVLVKILCHAQVFSYLPIPLYHYVESNLQSTTKVFKIKHIHDRLKLVDEVASYLANYGKLYAYQIALMKALRKAKILLLTNADKQYINLYPEINGLLLSMKLSYYTKIILLLATTGNNFLLKSWLRFLKRIGK